MSFKHKNFLISFLSGNAPHLAPATHAAHPPLKF